MLRLHVPPSGGSPPFFGWLFSVHEQDFALEGSCFHLRGSPLNMADANRSTLRVLTLNCWYCQLFVLFPFPFLHRQHLSYYYLFKLSCEDAKVILIGIQRTVKKQPVVATSSLVYTLYQFNVQGNRYKPLQILCSLIPCY